jgi:hypothetical protein
MAVTKDEKDSEKNAAHKSKAGDEDWAENLKSKVRERKKKKNRKKKH